jgi:hypothetical protein
MASDNAIQAYRGYGVTASMTSGAYRHDAWHGSDLNLSVQWRHNVGGHVRGPARGFNSARLAA